MIHFFLEKGSERDQGNAGKHMHTQTHTHTKADFKLRLPDEVESSLGLICDSQGDTELCRPRDQKVQNLSTDWAPH